MGGRRAGRRQRAAPAPLPHTLSAQPRFAGREVAGPGGGGGVRVNLCADPSMPTRVQVALGPVSHRRGLELVGEVVGRRGGELESLRLFQCKDGPWLEVELAGSQ